MPVKVTQKYKLYFKSTNIYFFSLLVCIYLNKVNGFLKNFWEKAENQMMAKKQKRWEKRPSWRRWCHCCSEDHGNDDRNRTFTFSRFPHFFFSFLFQQQSSKMPSHFTEWAFGWIENEMKRKKGNMERMEFKSIPFSQNLTTTLPCSVFFLQIVVGFAREHPYFTLIQSIKRADWICIFSQMWGHKTRSYTLVWGGEPFPSTCCSRLKNGCCQCRFSLVIHIAYAKCGFFFTRFRSETKGWLQCCRWMLCNFLWFRIRKFFRESRADSFWDGDCFWVKIFAYSCLSRINPRKSKEAAKVLAISYLSHPVYFIRKNRLV